MRELDHAPTCCQQPSKLRGNKKGCSSHEGTSMPMPRKGCNERGVHYEGTQPKAVVGESRHAHGHGARQEAPGLALTVASPMSRHSRRHSGHGYTWAHADATRAESSKRGRGLPFTRSSACSCNNCCCRISNCLCSSSNCRLMYSWRHG